MSAPNSIPPPPPPCGPIPTPLIVEVPENYEGVVAGISRSERFQRVVVKVVKSNGQEIFRSNLIGSGENLPLRSQIDQTTGGIAFGPFTYSVNLQFTIEHAASEGSGSFQASRVIEPITVKKAPSNNYQHHTQVTTILSEQGDDTDFNDAIITVFAFK